MNVAQLRRLQQAVPGRTDRGPGLPTPRSNDGPGFQATLEDAINRVDGAQKNADGQIEAFVAGEQENLHEVMISMNQAELHFDLMNEVRNKALDTYQELMRMQI